MLILVVDDDPQTRTSLQWLLHDAGYLVDTAADGLDALGCLDRCKYELILTDLDMPRLDGTSLWKCAVEAGHPGKWIVMTGTHLDPRLEASPFPVVQKPFRFFELVSVIERVCTQNPA